MGSVAALGCNVEITMAVSSQLPKRRARELFIPFLMKARKQ
jgi:hypothetical protein